MQVVVDVRAASMQGMAQAGISASVWAETVATRAAAAKEYFMLSVG